MSSACGFSNGERKASVGASGNTFGAAARRVASCKRAKEASDGGSDRASCWDFAENGMASDSTVARWSTAAASEPRTIGSWSGGCSTCGAGP